MSPPRQSSSAIQLAPSARARKESSITSSTAASLSSSRDPLGLEVSDGASAEVAAAEAGHRLGRNVTALAGGQLVTWTMTLLWTLVVPRALGPEGLGIVVS